MWPLLAFPGTVWMVAFFAVPFYGVMAIAGGRDNILFNTRDPRWNPFSWHWDAFHTVWQGILNGDFGQPFLRTFEYVFASIILGVAVAVALVTAVDYVGTARALRRDAGAR